MKVKEIIENYTWDHALQLQAPKREKDITWHHELQDKPKEQMYVVVDKHGKAVRTNLSHKAATYMKERPDLVKKHGQLRIVKI